METNRRLAELLLNKVPEDGSPVGNAALREQFFAAAGAAGLKATEAQFEELKAGLVTVGALVRGKGRGGSVRRLLAEELGGAGFDLAAQEAPAPQAKPVAPKAKAAATSALTSRAASCTTGTASASSMSPRRARRRRASST